MSPSSPRVPSLVYERLTGGARSGRPVSLVLLWARLRQQALPIFVVFSPFADDAETGYDDECQAGYAIITRSMGPQQIEATVFAFADLLPSGYFSSIQQMGLVNSIIMCADRAYRTN